MLMLRANLFFCVMPRALVFLDVRADRYFALALDYAGVLDNCSAAPAEATAYREPVQLVEDLIEVGILVDGVFHRPGDVVVKPTTMPVRQVAATRCGKRLLLRAAFWRLVSSAGLAVLPLHRMLAYLGKQASKRSHRQNRPSATAEALAAAFRRIDLLTGVQSNCLARSVALTIAARRSGLETSLVIGVRSPPFAAHSWVQIGDLLLNDRLEHVRLFTPILVV